MKKKNILFLLPALLIPTSIKADMSGPMMIPYEMVVTATEGIDCPTSNNKETYHISKDEKFTVNFESTNRYYITYNNNNCELSNLNGTVLLKEELDPKKEYKENDYSGEIRKLSTPHKVLIYSDEGVDILKGPASVYKKIGHLSKNKELSYQYYTDDYLYIEDGDTKGWINILEKKVLMENKTKYITLVDIALSCGTISKNTIITPKYTTDKWSAQVVIAYNDCEKIIPSRYSSEISQIYTIKYHSNKELTVYEYLNDEGKVLTTIPQDTDFISYAREGRQGEEIGNFYVEYNNVKGWIKAKYEDCKYIEDLNTTLPETDIPEESEPSKEKSESKNTEAPFTIVAKWCLIGLTIVITAAALIILLNKNKKNNKENNNM